MLVYFNKIKLDRTSFLLTKRLAWASVTRTERGIKDNFSRFLLKRILPRIGRFLLSSYGKSVSSFDRSFRPGEVSILLSNRIRPHSHVWEHFYVALPKKRINYSSSGVLPHLRRNSCPYSWIHLLLTERKEYASFANIRSRNWGTHCTTRLLTQKNHRQPKDLRSLPSPLSTTEPPLGILIIAIIKKSKGAKDEVVPPRAFIHHFHIDHYSTC